MVLSKIANRIHSLPIVRDSCIRHYGSLRHAFHRLNRRLPLMKTPIYVHWLATYDCNFHCRHCEADAGDRTVDLLTTEEISRAVTDMGVMGVRTLVVTGGEPLLREDLFEIFSLARSRGIPNLYLATNGYLVERFKDQLREAGLSRVYISIDGLEATHDPFRGKRDSFRRALQALDFFKTVGVQERIVNTLVHPGNLSELEELKQIFMNSPVTLWNIQIAVPAGRAKDSPSLDLHPHQIRNLFDFIRKTREVLDTQIAETVGYLGKWESPLRPQPFFCRAGLETCSILPDGEVLGCHLVYDTRYSAGNIREIPFKAIWEKNRNRFPHPDLDPGCRSCKYRSACRGGCWGMRIGHKHCLKDRIEFE